MMATTSPVARPVASSGVPGITNRFKAICLTGARTALRSTQRFFLPRASSSGSSGPAPQVTCPNGDVRRWRAETGYLKDQVSTNRQRSNPTHDRPLRLRLPTFPLLVTRPSRVRDDNGGLR
jgi:hypothetical protein